VSHLLYLGTHFRGPLTCTAFFGAILALVMPEKPLSGEMIQVAEGKVEVPEY
jgi:hypothetical protein